MNEIVVMKPIAIKKIAECCQCKVDGPCNARLAGMYGGRKGHLLLQIFFIMADIAAAPRTIGYKNFVRELLTSRMY